MTVTHNDVRFSAGDRRSLPAKNAHDAAHDFPYAGSHGSQYAADGSVTRGPAPRSLTLADVSVRDDGKVLLRPWQGADFRTATAAS